MKTRLNVGLIGLGRLGRAYARYLSHQIPHARLVAVADLEKAVVSEISDELSVEITTIHYHDLLADKSLDAIVVATPTNTHKDIVISAAKSKKAVFCEKPLALSMEDANEILQAVESNAIFFHMGYMRRFDRGYVAAKKQIEDGVIGLPLVFKSTTRDPQRPSLEYLNPSNSGGIFIDMGIHDFDLARWYMGEVKTVSSIGGTLAYPELKTIGDQDNAITNLTFRTGNLGVIDLSRNAVYGYDIQTEILGTKGTLRVGYLRHTPMLVMTKEGISHDTVPYFFERFQDAYVDQLRDFVEKCLADKSPSIECIDGVRSLEISIAATKSFKDSRPVELTKGT